MMVTYFFLVSLIMQINQTHKNTNRHIVNEKVSMEVKCISVIENLFFGSHPVLSDIYKHSTALQKQTEDYDTVYYTYLVTQTTKNAICIFCV